MPAVSEDFLFSTETECLTVLEGAAGSLGHAPTMRRFREALAGLAASLPGAAGFFNGYGRVYLDGGHLEFAAAECDSPYLLPIWIEQQWELARQAARQVDPSGRLILACNNHGGLL